MRPICALQAVTTMLLGVVLRQRDQYLQGDYDELGALPALMILHNLIRWGVCRHTKRLTEMPDLTPYLNQLPDHMRVALEWAIEQEQAGQRRVRASYPPITLAERRQRTR